jgi:hypothetical protein
MSPRCAISDATEISDTTESVAAFDGPHEITDGIDMIRYDPTQLKARDLILYGDYQFEPIEPVRSEVVAKTRLVRDAAGIDAKMSSDDLAYPAVDIRLHDRASF